MVSRTRQFLEEDGGGMTEGTGRGMEEEGGKGWGELWEEKQEQEHSEEAEGEDDECRKRVLIAEARGSAVSFCRPSPASPPHQLEPMALALSSCQWGITGGLRDERSPDLSPRAIGVVWPHRMPIRENM